MAIQIPRELIFWGLLLFGLFELVALFVGYGPISDLNTMLMSFTGFFLTGVGFVGLNDKHEWVEIT